VRRTWGPPHLTLLNAADPSFAALSLRLPGSILTNLFGVSHVTIVATPIDEPQPWEYSTSVPTKTGDSEADDPAARIELRIYPSAMHKCPRCWDFTSPREEMLCVRCETVVRKVEATDAAP